jgi:hypothetical protein
VRLRHSSGYHAIRHSFAVAAGRLRRGSAAELLAELEIHPQALRDAAGQCADELEVNGGAHRAAFIAGFLTALEVSRAHRRDT